LFFWRERKTGDRPPLTMMVRPITRRVI